MGCGPSTLAVAALNRSLETNEGPDVLQSKLHASPWLLSATASVLSTTAGTPLHTACERKQVEVVQQMLSFLTGASLSVVREALQPYCRRNGLVLPQSVAEGVRIAVGMVNCKGQTPLMCACAAGSPELVKLLMAQGADPWAVDLCGCRTALHNAAMSGSVPCIEALLSSQQGLTQPAVALETSREDVRYVNVRTSSGLTALHYAVFFDHPSAVEELLRHDPQTNAVTSSHSYDVDTSCDALSTPLHFAAVRGNVAVVRQLLRHHALHPTTPGGTRARDPRLRANYGHRTPWQIAANNHPENRELVTMLHPGQSLEEVLGLMASGTDGSAAPLSSQLQLLPLGARMGPPSLASIAAAALQTRLLGDLQRLLVPPPPTLLLPQQRQQKQEQQQGQQQRHGPQQEGETRWRGEVAAAASPPVGPVEASSTAAGAGGNGSREAEKEVTEEKQQRVSCTASASTEGASSSSSTGSTIATSTGRSTRLVATANASSQKAEEMSRQVLKTVHGAVITSARASNPATVTTTSSSSSIPLLPPSTETVIGSSNSNTSCGSSCSSSKARVDGSGKEFGERRGQEEAVVVEEEDGVLCGVCFVERETVAPAGCGHGVCGRCAERMCRMALGGSSRPPCPLLCPFCRRELTRFEGVAAMRGMRPARIAALMSRSDPFDARR